MSTPDTFRDALAALAQRVYDQDADGTPSAFLQLDLNVADAVLTSAEMQAIRKALQRSASNAARYAYPQGHPDLRVRGYLENNCGLPAHLIAWVLDDPSPDNPTDKPCETCGGRGQVPGMHHAVGDLLFPCPSCRGGEQT